jgi:RNA polymerase sigma factor for flagellar operon FliA
VDQAVQAGTQAYQQVAVQGRRDDLILEHLWLVRHIVGRITAQLPPETDLANLESAGMLGLVEAATKFDPVRGVKFVTYAYPRVRGAILDELRRNCPLPQHVLERIGRVRKAYDEIEGTATVAKVAATSGLSEDEVSDCLSAMRLTRMVSWEGAAESLEAHLTDRDDRPDVQAERAEQKRLLAQGIASLTERERLVVTLYYLEELRLKEIGQLLELSESRVSRLLSSAMFHLGEYVRARTS